MYSISLLTLVLLFQHTSVAENVGTHSFNVSRGPLALLLQVCGIEFDFDLSV